jgi:hypothetical protein
MQKVEGSNPFSRSPESLAFAGLSAFLGRTSRRPRRPFPTPLVSSLSKPRVPCTTGRPPRACDPASRNCVDPAPGPHSQRAMGTVSGAKRRGARLVERGCGARAPKGARRPRRPCNPAPARAARSALAKTYRNTEAHKRLLAKLKDLLGPLGCHKTSIPRWSVLSQQVPLAGIAHNCGTVRFGTDPKRSALDLARGAPLRSSQSICLRDQRRSPRRTSMRPPIAPASVVHSSAFQHWAASALAPEVAIGMPNRRSIRVSPPA